MAKPHSHDDPKPEAADFADAVEDGMESMVANWAIGQADELAEKNPGFGIIWNLLKLPIVLTFSAIFLALTYVLFRSGSAGGIIGGFIVGLLAVGTLLVGWGYIRKIWSNLKKIT